MKDTTAGRIIIGLRKDLRPIYATMGGADGDGDAAEAAAAATKATEEAATAAKATEDAEAAKARKETVDDLPEWAKKLVSDARAESARDRTAQTTKAAEDAAKAATAKITADIAEALGITKKDAEKLDPAELQRQLQASQGSNAEAARELALWRVADDLGVKAGKLLDSRKFMSSISSVKADDTGTLKAKVEEALKADPSLRSGAGQAPGSSSVDHTGRPGEGTRKVPKSLEDAVAGSFAAGQQR